MRPALFSALFCLALAATARAQVPGDSIRLTLKTGDRVDGTFLERNSEAWRLTVSAPDPRLIPVRDVQTAQRQVVRTRSQLRSQSMAVGMLLGFGAMYAVYATEIKSSEPSLGNLLILPLGAAGAGMGAVVGLAVGSSRAEVVWRTVR